MNLILTDEQHKVVETFARMCLEVMGAQQAQREAFKQLAALIGEHERAGKTWPNQFAVELPGERPRTFILTKDPDCKPIPVAAVAPQAEAQSEE